MRLGGSQQRDAGSAGFIGGSYLGQDTVGPLGGDPIKCKNEENGSRMNQIAARHSVETLGTLAV